MSRAKTVTFGGRSTLTVALSRSAWLCALPGLLLAALCVLALQGTANAAFPGTNDKVVFQGQGRMTDSSSTKGNADIYVMNRDGSDQTNLTSGSSAWESEPKLSPDSTKVAYVKQYGSIYVMNVNGSGATQVTNDGHSPTWAPDGKKIAFVRGMAIYSVNIDGSGLTRLTGASTLNGGSNLAWSPDGREIAFESLNNYYDPAIFVMNADGSNIRNLSGTGLNVYDDAPSWSPDGTKIAFERANSVYVMNADGTNKHEVSYDYGTNPAWSPDGTKIVYEGDFDLFMMDAEGGNVTQMTSSSDSYFSSPDWGRVPPPKPPNIASSAPVPDKTGISRKANVKTTFSNEMDINTLTKYNVTLYKNGATWPISAKVTPSASGSSVTLNPYGGTTKLLAGSTWYQAVIWKDSEGVKDKVGNPLGGGGSYRENPGGTYVYWWFKTGLR
jgi:TolB protein